MGLCIDPSLTLSCDCGPGLASLKKRTSVMIVHISSSQCELAEGVPLIPEGSYLATGPSGTCTRKLRDLPQKLPFLPQHLSKSKTNHP